MLHDYNYILNIKMFINCTIIYILNIKTINSCIHRITTVTLNLSLWLIFFSVYLLKYKHLGRLVLFLPKTFYRKRYRAEHITIILFRFYRHKLKTFNYITKLIMFSRKWSEGHRKYETCLQFKMNKLFIKTKKKSVTHNIVQHIISITKIYFWMANTSTQFSP